MWAEKSDPCSWALRYATSSQNVLFLLWISPLPAGSPLDIPQAGPGPYPIHTFVWERKDREMRLATSGKLGSEGIPLAKWG